MGADNIQLQPDSTGKKVQTWSNVIGADTVHAEAMVPVDSAGTELALATEATLAVLDAKVTACNTGAVVLAAGTASIGSIAYKDTLVNGTIDAVDEYVEIATTGLGSLGIQITGAWSGGGGALEFRGTVDGTNWVQIRAVQFGGTLVGGTTVNGLFFAQAGGLLKVRVYATVWVGVLEATVYIEGTAATNAVTLANALPTGTNVIGQVTIEDLENQLGAARGTVAIDYLGITYNADGTVNVITAKTAVAGATIYTLTCAYTSGNLTSITRT